MIHNQTIDNQLNHRTIRAFKDQSLTADQLQTLYAAASHTSTSMFMQQFSILHLTDPQLRQASCGKLSGKSLVSPTSEPTGTC